MVSVGFNRQSSEIYAFSIGARRRLSALPNAIELVCGRPRRKSARSLPVAAPVNEKCPRGSCCDRTWTVCGRAAPPNVNAWPPRVRQMLSAENPWVWL